MSERSKRGPVTEKPTPLDDERRIIRRALGLDVSPTPFSNHLVARSRGTNRGVCEAMVTAGLLEYDGPARGSMQTYRVTQAGADLVGARLPDRRYPMEEAHD